MKQNNLSYNLCYTTFIFCSRFTFSNTNLNNNLINKFQSIFLYISIFVFVLIFRIKYIYPTYLQNLISKCLTFFNFLILFYSLFNEKIIIYIIIIIINLYKYVIFRINNYLMTILFIFNRYSMHKYYLIKILQNIILY